MRCPKEHLRRSVPAGGHIVCVRRPRLDLPRQPEVRQLDYQQIPKIRVRSQGQRRVRQEC
eukprot:scaffold897_cov402-Prasinococcus_capsulatus_cf.AAC.74